MPIDLGLVDLIKLVWSVGEKCLPGGVAKWKNANARKQLIGKVAAVEEVKTFGQLDKDVPLSSFYYPTRLSGIDKLLEVDNLAQLPRTGNLVIEGTVGQGKSMFLRHLCAQELRGTAIGAHSGVRRAQNRLGEGLEGVGRLRTGSTWLQRLRRFVRSLCGLWESGALARWVR